jgi:selenide,water dikinase
MGHGHELAHLSGCGLRLQFDQLPWLPGAETYAREWVFPGGTERNEVYYAQWLTLERALSDWQRMLLFDPQTSGGLLVAVQSDQAEAYARESGGWVVGEVVPLAPGTIVVV